MNKPPGDIKGDSNWKEDHTANAEKVIGHQLIRSKLKAYVSSCWIQMKEAYHPVMNFFEAQLWMTI